MLYPTVSQHKYPCSVWGRFSSGFDALGKLMYLDISVRAGQLVLPNILIRMVDKKFEIISMDNV